MLFFQGILHPRRVLKRESYETEKDSMSCSSIGEFNQMSSVGVTSDESDTTY